MLAVLAAWVLVPLVALLVRPLIHGGVFTGVTGTDPYDEYQYLAWIREMGSHGLSANLFGLTGGGHVFVQPMWLISGILWRLGLGLQASYLIWSPISVLVLWWGTMVFARRMGATGGRRVAILAVGLFFASPIGWLNLPGTHWVAEMQLGLTDSSAAVQTWFAVHTAVALGVMPAVLLGCLRLRRATGPHAYRSKLAWWTAAGAGLVSWVHSWQGATLALILIGLTVTRRPRRSDLVLALPLVGCAAPLIYQWALTRFDAAWAVAEKVNDRPDLVVITPQLAVLGPLIAAAVFGLIRHGRPRSDADWMLLLWPLAAIVVYRFDPEFPPHALQGVALPLAALAVRGWPRGRHAAALGVAGIVACTVPGLVYFAKGFAPAVRANRPMFFQTAGEHAALAFVARQPPSGAVMAPMALALEVPAFTDHAVWDGHQTWTPDAVLRAQEASNLLSGSMPAPQARALVARTRVRWLIADCPPDGRQVFARLGAEVIGIRRFGCVAVARVSGHATNGGR